jgi:endoplasmic reticulum chaperone BiP
MDYSIGDSAKHAFASNPKNTIFDAKRLIGRRMDDPEVVQDLKHLSVDPFRSLPLFSLTL